MRSEYRNLSVSYATPGPGPILSVRVPAVCLANGEGPAIPPGVPWSLPPFSVTRSVVPIRSGSRPGSVPSGLIEGVGPERVSGRSPAQPCSSVDPCPPPPPLSLAYSFASKITPRGESEAKLFCLPRMSSPHSSVAVLMEPFSTSVKKNIKMGARPNGVPSELLAQCRRSRNRTGVSHLTAAYPEGRSTTGIVALRGSKPPHSCEWFIHGPHLPATDAALGDRLTLWTTAGYPGDRRIRKRLKSKRWTFLNIE